MTQLAARQPRPKPRKKPLRNSDAENDIQADADIKNDTSMFHLRPHKLTPTTSKHAAKKNKNTVIATQNNLLPPKPSLTRAAAGNLLNGF
jgi:hypothetical protein